MRVRVCVCLCFGVFVEVVILRLREKVTRPGVVAALPFTCHSRRDDPRVTEAVAALIRSPIRLKLLYSRAIVTFVLPRSISLFVITSVLKT